MADSPVYVGVIARAHGIKGEVTVRPDSDNPTRFAAGAQFTTDSAEHPALVVTRSRSFAKGGFIVAFAGVLDRTSAEALRGTELYIDAADRRPLEPGEYWPEDLVGLEVHVDGEVLGHVRAVEMDTAQIRLSVRLNDGRSADVPFVEPLVPVVDTASGYIEVVQLDGLLSEP